MYSRDHSLNAHSKFSESLHFLAPDMHTYMRISGGKKYRFFGTFYVRTE